MFWQQDQNNNMMQIGNNFNNYPQPNMQYGYAPYQQQFNQGYPNGGITWIPNNPQLTYEEPQMVTKTSTLSLSGEPLTLRSEEQIMRDRENIVEKIKELNPAIRNGDEELTNVYDLTDLNYNTAIRNQYYGYNPNQYQQYQPPHGTDHYTQSVMQQYGGDPFGDLKHKAMCNAYNIPYQPMVQPQQNQFMPYPQQPIYQQPMMYQPQPQQITVSVVPPQYGGYYNNYMGGEPHHKIKYEQQFLSPQQIMEHEQNVFLIKKKMAHVYFGDDMTNEELKNKYFPTPKTVELTEEDKTGLEYYKQIKAQTEFGNMKQYQKDHPTNYIPQCKLEVMARQYMDAQERKKNEQYNDYEFLYIRIPEMKKEQWLLKNTKPVTKSDKMYDRTAYNDLVELHGFAEQASRLQEDYADRILNFGLNVRRDIENGVYTPEQEAIILEQQNRELDEIMNGLNELNKNVKNRHRTLGGKTRIRIPKLLRTPGSTNYVEEEDDDDEYFDKARQEWNDSIQESIYRKQQNQLKKQAKAMGFEVENTDMRTTTTFTKPKDFVPLNLIDITLIKDHIVKASGGRITDPEELTTEQLKAIKNGIDRGVLNLQSTNKRFMDNLNKVLDGEDVIDMKPIIPQAIIKDLKSNKGIVKPNIIIDDGSEEPNKVYKKVAKTITLEPGEVYDPCYEAMCFWKLVKKLQANNQMYILNMNF